MTTDHEQLTTDGFLCYNITRFHIQGDNMKSEKIGVGLVGTGFARSTQLPAFRAYDGAEVVAVCSGHYENAQRTAAEFGLKHACKDYRELVALDDVSLVIVAAPPYLHH